MRSDSAAGRTAAPRLAVTASVTFVALYLVWAAFHDIAHREADLTTEYTLLVVSAVWLTYVAVRLILTRHRLLGSVSLLALGAGLWGQRGIGAEGTAGLSSTDLALTAAFVWFLLLTGILAVMSWQASREGQN
jgi:hypothetical protein